MRSRALRWLAVPAIAAAGFVLAAYLFVEIYLDCFHLGARPQGLCSDWWYTTHTSVAVGTCGLCMLILCVGLPIIVAPSYKNVVGAVASAGVITASVLSYEPWVSKWLVSIVLVGATIGAGVIAFRYRRIRTHVA